jgi:hypothetical protein
VAFAGGAALAFFSAVIQITPLLEKGIRNGMAFSTVEKAAGF